MAWNGAKAFRFLQLGGFGLDVNEPIVLFPFRELIGALLWIALLTRLHIANAVGAVARYYSAPKLIHWKAERGICLLYTSPSPRDLSTYRMPSSA